MNRKLVPHHSHWGAFNAVVKDGRCYLNVGGAIVADSDPIAEYAETMDKARALIMALNNLATVGRRL